VNRIRITGLVKLMNHVREALSTGIPPGEQENFRAMVKDNLRQVEEICREYKTSPEQLPAPTYRAYRYLKELDLSQLPVAKKSPKTSPQRLRVRNLITSCKTIQQELSEITLRDKKKRKSATIKDPQVMVLLFHIRQLVEQVEKMIHKAGGGVSALSHQSRRAYQWLRFLSEADNLEQHLSTLHCTQSEIEALVNQPKYRPRYPGMPVRFELYNLPAVYRVSQQEDFLLIEAHEGFVGAPVEVIRALALVALAGKGGSSLSKLKTYAQTEAFLTITSALEGTYSPTTDRSQGQHFDLQQIFERVNQTYFNGEIEKPALMWNKTLTHRKFGHYQANTDTIMISISLDKASTPAYVLEYVMYHELLHKQLGVVTNNGRRYAHTKAFREAEARFPKQKQAEAYLNELSTKISRGKSWKPKK
jgi:hypothetical protein